MAILKPFSFNLKNGEKLTARSIAPADAEEFLSLRTRVAKETNHTLQYVGMSNPSVQETADRLAAQEAEATAMSIGIFNSSEKLVGNLGFRSVRSGHPWVQHVGEFGMMILKDYWGHGIGKKLLDLMEIHAKSHQFTRLEATVRVTNGRGVKLYTKSGYTIEGTKRAAAKIDKEYVDEYYIAKILEVPSAAKWMPPTLTTDRLILRPLQVSDAEAIFEYSKNPNVSRYTLWEPHQTIEAAKDLILSYAASYYAKGVPEPLGITLKGNSNTVIGTVGCFWVSEAAKSMELAYALNEDFWGKGLMAEAANAVMDFCFKTYSLKRIQARARVENVASTRVMEKTGMSYEGTLKSSLYYRGRHWDMAYFAKVL